MSIRTLNLIPGIALTTTAATTGAAAPYASPANVTTRLTAATACNTGTTTVKITAYVVRSGGAPAVANEAIAGLPIGPGLTYNCPELYGKTLGPGDYISVKDDTGAVTGFTVDGYQIS